MTSAYDILVGGQICLDMLPEMGQVSAEGISTPGRLFVVGDMHMSTGGGVANTGLALHRLGAHVGLMSKVGADTVGQMILAIINAASPHLTEHIRLEQGASSSYTIVLSPENRDRSFLHCPGTNEHFTTADIDFDLVGRSRLFHLAYPPLLPRLVDHEGEQLADVMRRAHENGAVTSMDMALPDPSSPAGHADWRAVLRRTLPYVDCFIPSIDEITFMLRRSDYDAWKGQAAAHVGRAYLVDLARELHAMGAGMVGFKLGEAGCFLSTPEDTGRLLFLTKLGQTVERWRGLSLWQGAFRAAVVGTTGAGDAAYAGFLAALLRGLAPQDALQMACAVGACCVEAADATSGVRSWEETRARLAAGWETSSLALGE